MVDKAEFPIGASTSTRPSEPFRWVALLAPTLLAVVTALIFIWSTTRGPELDMARSTILPFGVVVALSIWSGRASALKLVRRLVAPVRAQPRRSLWFFLVGLLLALLLLARVALDAFPNSGDEYAYILQAQTFLRGRLWVDAPPVGEAFALMRFVQKAGHWLSIYQPGWPLLLALPQVIQLPVWLVNPLLGVGTAWAFFSLTTRLARAEAAWLALLGLCTSAFFLFNFACLMAHGSGAFAAMLLALCGTRYLQEGDGRWALLAGAALGGLGFIRAANAVLLLPPFLLALLGTPGRRRGVFLFALGGLPFALALLAYNKAITGNPFWLVQAWVAPGREPIGVGGGAGPSSFLAETWSRLARLYLWTSPAFLVGWGAAFAFVAWRRKLTFVDWMAPLTVVGFAFYGGNGGSQYGPRYYFEAWPLAFVTIAKALEPLFVSDFKQAKLVAAALVSHLAFQVGYLAPRVHREHLIVRERQDVFTQVAAANLSNAVVLLFDTPDDEHRMLRSFPSADLVRNGLHVGDQPVIYALDRRPELTAQLFEHFAGRRFYRYYHGRLQYAQDAEGRLLPKPADGK